MAKVEVRFAFRLSQRKQFVIACEMVEGTVAAGMHALIWLDGGAYWDLPILGIEYIDRVSAKEAFIGLVCAEHGEEDAETAAVLCPPGTVIDVVGSLANTLGEGRAQGWKRT